MINRELKIGDKIWYAKCNHESVSVQCPVCFGKLSITLILGNDEVVKVPCKYCDNFLGPKGIVNEWKWISVPALITIDEVQAREREGFRNVEYRYNNSYCVDVNDIFETEEEALIECNAKISEHIKNENSTTASRKNENHRSYSWNVGYHKEQIRKLKQQLEYNESQLIFCKEKVDSKKSKITL